MPTVHYETRIETLLSRLDRNPKVSKSNRAIIKKFYNQLVLDNYSDARKCKFLIILGKIAEENKIDFLHASREDIEKVVLWINKRKDITETTRHDYRALLKRFYRWVGKGEYPECVSWLKIHKANGNGKLPEEMLTEEDIMKLLDATNHPRDRALVSLLWETGARMGELIDLKIKSFEDHQHGLKIVVDGKTGQRRIPLIDSVPDVNAWLLSHPNRKDPNAPMWVNIGTRNAGNQMEYPAIYKMLSETAKKAGIQKPIHPHHFRHSRATYLANRFTEAQLCQWFGWVLGSNIPGKYVHLSGRDIDTEYARLHGIAEEDKPKESKLTPKSCPRCSHKVPIHAKFCYKCGMLLDMQMAMEVEGFQKINAAVQAETMNAALSGQKIDLDMLAELVVAKMKKQATT